MINESLLRLTVEEDLAAFQTQNAVFVAEKLVAGFPTPESKHLLARAYLQANDTQRAFCTLYPASTPKNRLCARARLAGPCDRAVLCAHPAFAAQVPTCRLRPAAWEAQGGGDGAAGLQVWGRGCAARCVRVRADGPDLQVSPPATLLALCGRRAVDQSSSVCDPGFYCCVMCCSVRQGWEPQCAGAREFFQGAQAQADAVGVLGKHVSVAAASAFLCVCMGARILRDKRIRALYVRPHSD